MFASIFVLKRAKDLDYLVEDMPYRFLQIMEQLGNDEPAVYYVYSAFIWQLLNFDLFSKRCYRSNDFFFNDLFPHKVKATILDKIVEKN